MDGIRQAQTVASRQIYTANPPQTLRIQYTEFPYCLSKDNIKQQHKATKRLSVTQIRSNKVINCAIDDCRTDTKSGRKTDG